MSQISVLENFDCDEYNDIEEVRNRVEKCVALMVDHLGDRSERSSSTGSMTSSWVRRHAVGNFESVSGGQSEPSVDLNLGQGEFDTSTADIETNPPAPSENPAISVSGAAAEGSFRPRTSTVSNMDDVNTSQLEEKSASDIFEDLDATVKKQTDTGDSRNKRVMSGNTGENHHESNFRYCYYSQC